jgi:probable F420-dependent oxidoreductase
VKLDSVAFIPNPVAARDDATEARARGFDGWFTAEVGYDPFVACAVAADAVEGQLDIGTAIAVAFARTPMTVAYSANDLQGLTGGRFVLGLGSQIKPHIERRYGMPWSKPAARMREFIAALHAIWHAWEHEEKLDFRGDFYEHTLMTPFFSGTNHGFGPPRVAMAAVGPLMTQVCGEAADIFLAHSFTTAEYLRDESMPKLHAGAEKAGRDPSEVEVAMTAFVVTGRTEEERAGVDALVRSQIGFYGSTPAYRPVLEHHGWGDLQTELNRLSKEGRWAEMGEAIDDEVLDAFALVVDDPDQVGQAYLDRFGDLATRAGVYPTWQPDARAVEAMKATLSGA